MINIACFHISYFSIKPPPYNRFFNIVTILSCICLVFFKRIVFPERLCTLGRCNLQRPGGAAAGGLRPPAPGCRKSGLRHFFEVFIAPLRLRRGQGAMQGNPCYARLFADLTRMSPNPIIASGGCGPRAPRGFSTSCGGWAPPTRPQPVARLRACFWRGRWPRQKRRRRPPGRLGACRREKGRRAGKFAGSGGSHGPGPPGIERAFFLFIIYA